MSNSIITSLAAANLKKHKVSFEEAKTVFDNALAVIFNDEAHSVNEQREIIIGHSQKNRLLLVSFTERQPRYPYHQCPSSYSTGT